MQPPSATRTPTAREHLRVSPSVCLSVRVCPAQAEYSAGSNNGGKMQRKVKYTDIAIRSLTCHTATGTHMPYGIIQCYLPPDRGDIPAFTPAEAGTRLSDPGGTRG